MALAADASTPAFAKGTANPTTTASFSPPSQSSLYAFCIADESNTFTLAGGGLTWTKIDQLSVAGLCSITTWFAYAASAPGSLTVSSTKTGSFTAHGLKVAVFTGAETSFTGAHGTAQSNTISLTATQTGSWIWGLRGNELGTTTDTASAGCTWNDAESAFGGVSAGILRRTTADGVSGNSVAIGAGSAASNMSIAAVEVKAATAGGPAPVPLMLVSPAGAVIQSATW